MSKNTTNSLVIFIICFVTYIHQINSNSILLSDGKSRHLQNVEMNTCGFYKCPKYGGECTGQFKETCTCNDEYATYPYDTDILCQYKKKKQLIAFLLEFFLMLGIGHYYLENYVHAILKSIIFLTAYSLFITLKFLSVKTEQNNPYRVVISLIASLFLITIIIWQCIDVILMGIGFYTDGNGVELYFMTN